MALAVKTRMVEYFTAVVIQLLLCVNGIIATNIVYLDDHCDGNFRVFDADRIIATSSDVIKPKVGVCRIYLTTLSTSKYLMLNIQQMTTQCSACAVNVYNSSLIDPKTKITSKGLCVGQGDISYNNMSPDLSIELDMVKSHCPGNFSFVVTLFHTGQCLSNEISCSNGQCIDSKLKCDSINNCGDNSDEKHCNHGNKPTCQFHWVFIVFAMVVIKLT